MSSESTVLYCTTAVILGGGTKSGRIKLEGIVE